MTVLVSRVTLSAGWYHTVNENPHHGGAEA
jgi:hypothetical protein